MPIRVWDYLEEYASEKLEIQEAIESVLASGQLILGPQVEQFEAEFAHYCGVAHGVGVASGTDALVLALRAVGIAEGDEVLTVANTAVPTVSAIVTAGARPRFVDVDRDTHLMDPAQVESALTGRTRALLPVHLYGQCVNMQSLRAIADRHDLKIVEDCAQSHGAEFRGAKAGSFSDAAAFSFYPTKLLGAYGDGGMVITQDAKIARRVQQLRFYGMEGRYYAETHGTNSRLDELQASILRKKLTHLDSYLANRRAIAERYDRMLGDTALQLPATAPGNLHAYYLYVVQHEERDRLVNALADRQIDVNVSYRWPIHTMRAYAAFGGGAGSLPRTEALADRIFSLPMYPTLKEEAQLEVIEAVRELAGGR